MNALAPFLYVALGAAVSSLLAGIARFQTSRKALASAAEQTFRDALNSSDLATMSRYLRQELGNIPLDSYLQDKDVRDRVDHYLARLNLFLAKPPDDTAAEPDLRNARSAEAAKFLGPTLVGTDNRPEIQAALASLREGDAWSALARLRRDLEIHLLGLRARGLQETLSLGPAHPSGRFSLTTDVPPSVMPNFRRFWRTASSAVHGQRVTYEEVLSAIREAEAVYAELDRLERENVGRD
ncbi:hypothetical protein [Brevundimonas sp.]|uniref:hypothetical protein n=1 Tax=Brevundimonas sp. TaxID=1871086 RepID=UPI0025C1FDE7|nr:hypothetical protein [Brevundimonas sp.]